MAEVWLMHAGGISDAVLQPFLAWLGEGEAARYQRFLRPGRQRQFLLGRILLRRALGALLGRAPSAVCLVERRGAAPLLLLPDAARGAPGFSLSHSGDWIACAVSADTALGLDIEVIDPTRDIGALSLQAFDASQLAILEPLSGQERLLAFYRMWSEKEARYKLGAGAVPSCVVLPHASLSMLVCSARPLAAAPELVLSTLFGPI